MKLPEELKQTVFDFAFNDNGRQFFGWSRKVCIVAGDGPLKFDQRTSPSILAICDHRIRDSSLSVLLRTGEIEIEFASMQGVDLSHLHKTMQALLDKGSPGIRNVTIRGATPKNNGSLEDIAAWMFFHTTFAAHLSTDKVDLGSAWAGETPIVEEVWEDLRQLACELVREGTQHRGMEVGTCVLAALRKHTNTLPVPLATRIRPYDSRVIHELSDMWEKKMHP